MTPLGWPLLLWVIFPYIALTMFFLGHVYRYATDKYGWGSHSTQLLERRTLRWASPLFHYGTLAVIAGHISGILVPIRWFHRLGVPDETYHVLAIGLGGLAGTAMVAGLGGLLWRRMASPRLRKLTSGADWLALGLLFVTSLLGLLVAVARNLAIGPYDYRVTVGPWFRALFTLHPDPTLMFGVPLLLQVHVEFSLLLFAVWPFTRLVHVWSFPFGYLTRAWIPFRPRGATRGGWPARPQRRKSPV
ncbi:MAG: respiratory nitrate reductase subunit gamma [Clostridia bacterium]|nr:respiratory nitrate reductase subunit gamma [Clostridia bacterium]